MKVYDDSSGIEFTFDELPKINNRIQVLFVTHMDNWIIDYLPHLKLPKIHTTAIVAAQISSFFSRQNLEFCVQNFHILPSFEPKTLQLNNDVAVDVLACEEDNDVLGGKHMILIKQDGELTHFYAGICTALRRTLLTQIFFDWIANGVPKLYLDLSNWTIPNMPMQAVCTQAVIEKVTSLLNNERTLVLIIPSLGFEQLIAKLVYSFRKLIAIVGSYDHLRTQLNGKLIENPSQAKVIITNCSSTIQPIPLENTQESRITIKITGSATARSYNGADDGFYVMRWSPVPTAFELRLLTSVLRPDEIINTSKAPIEIPNELIALSKPQISDNAANRTPTAISYKDSPTHPLRTSISPEKSMLSAYRIRKKHPVYVDVDSSGSD